jgi:hypothetical protein
VVFAIHSEHQQCQTDSDCSHEYGKIKGIVTLAESYSSEINLTLLLSTSLAEYVTSERCSSTAAFGLWESCAEELQAVIALGHEIGAHPHGINYDGTTRIDGVLQEKDDNLSNLLPGTHESLTDEAPDGSGSDRAAIFRALGEAIGQPIVSGTMSHSHGIREIDGPDLNWRYNIDGAADLIDTTYCQVFAPLNGAVRMGLPASDIRPEVDLAPWAEWRVHARIGNKEQLSGGTIAEDIADMQSKLEGATPGQVAGIIVHAHDYLAGPSPENPYPQIMDLLEAANVEVVTLSDLFDNAEAPLFDPELADTIDCRAGAAINSDDEIIEDWAEFAGLLP